MKSGDIRGRPAINHAVAKRIKEYSELKRPATARAVEAVSNKFLLFIGKNFEHATPKDVRGFLKLMLKKGLSPATIKQRMFLLQGFYRNLVYIEGAPSNPVKPVTALIDLPEIPVRPTKLIEFEAAKKLLKLPDTRTKKGLRNRVLLCVLFGCGLRRGEASKLELRDVQASTIGQPFLRLRAPKSKKTERVPVPRWAWRDLGRLIQQRRSEGATDYSPLFCFYYESGKSRGKLSNESVYRIYKRFSSAVGIPAGPHSARATGITKLLAEGKSHREVQKFSRHRSVRALERYDLEHFEVDRIPTPNFS